MSELLAMALTYAARGWRVLPLHSVDEEGWCSCADAAECAKAGKHPRVYRWPRLATTDPAVIRQWWSEHPEPNVGLAAGRASGFFALDIDTQHGGEQSLAELERSHGCLPNTVEHRTGSGGRHLLFAYPDASRIGNSARRLGPGLDARGEGGQIVAPPRRNANGTYTSITTITAPADAPPWLIDLLIRGAPDETVRPRANRKRVPDCIPQGQRNVELTRLAGRMRMAGTPPEAIAAALDLINGQRCKPPLPGQEVEDIAESIGSYLPLPSLTVPRTFFRDPQLDGIARHVLRALCDYADHTGTVRRITIAKLAQASGHSEDAISSAIKRLDHAGRISVTRRHRIPNVYRIHKRLSAQISEEQHTTTTSHLIDRPAVTGSYEQAEAAS
jgi:Bifunctional DNA primase/polymerase, N-terminal/Primase C terminal 1 (PriCT-1)